MKNEKLQMATQKYEEKQTTTNNSMAIKWKPWKKWVSTTRNVHSPKTEP